VSAEATSGLHSRLVRDEVSTLSSCGLLELNQEGFVLISAAVDHQRSRYGRAVVSCKMGGFGRNKDNVTCINLLCSLPIDLDRDFPIRGKQERPLQ